MLISALYTSFLAGISLDPLLRRLLKLLAVVLVLIGQRSLNSVIRVRFDQDVADHVQDGANLVWWLPLIAAQHAKTHRSLVVIADVGVVDLGLEVDDGRFEWVFGG